MAMVAVGLDASSAQVAFVEIGAASGLRGSSVSVPVTMTGSSGSVAGLQLDVLFDVAALGSTDPTCAAASGKPLIWSLPSQPPPPTGKRRLRLLVFDASSSASITDGQLGTCAFHIASGAPFGVTFLQGDGLVVSDAIGDTMNSSVSDGAVQVVSTCSGCGCGSGGAMAMGGGTGGGAEAASSSSGSLALTAADLQQRTRSEGKDTALTSFVDLRGLAPGAGADVGSVTVRGSLAGLASRDVVIQWQVREQSVTGSITGQDGTPLGRFTGVRSETGWSGSIEGLDSGASEWRWDQQATK